MTGETSFATRVSWLRGLLGLTQRELAERLGMARPETSGRQRVAKWERGASVPAVPAITLRALQHIAEAAGKGEAAARITGLNGKEDAP